MSHPIFRQLGNRSGNMEPGSGQLGTTTETQDRKLGRRKQKKYYKIKGVTAGDHYLSDPPREVVTALWEFVWL